MLDVSLAQVSPTLLGWLKVYEVAAFCYETRAGIKYIHDLNVVHGDLSSENAKIGMNGSRHVCHS